MLTTITRAFMWLILWIWLVPAAKVLEVFGFSSVLAIACDVSDDDTETAYAVTGREHLLVELLEEQLKVLRQAVNS